VLGEARLAEIAQQVLRASEADQTEVAITSNDSHLTRYATNTIHQNVSETDVSVRIRAVIEGKTGVASGNELEREGLTRIARSAETIARFQQANPDFRSLPEPKAFTPVDAVVEATANATPMERAEGAERVLKLSRAEGLEAAGAFSTEDQEIYVANSLGVGAYHRGTIASAMAVIMGKSSSGYGSQASIDIHDIDTEAVGRAAVDKAVRSQNPEPIEPGKYTVILEEEAVADMVFYLGYMGFGALAVQEERSFMNGKFGEKITGEAITIWDDGSDSRGLPLPFDFEGVPKQRVSLIENGVARAVVHDSFTAGREEGVESTGHALPMPNTFGPIPINLFLAPGDATKEEMLASTERGIWVTRFHYTNIVHPVQTILTGMTRDGTFLIENGKITKPLKNLRFTQSVLEALSNVVSLGRNLKLVKDEWNSIGTCVPAVKIDGFQFTGTTEH
jgi:PmbA protein